MDLRAQTFLVSATLALAIAISVLLRPRKSQVHWLFVGFATAVAAWYGTSFASAFIDPRIAEFGPRARTLCAALVGLSSDRFFRALSAGSEARRVSAFSRLMLMAGAVLVLLSLTPYHETANLAWVAAAFAFGILASCLLRLARGASTGRSRFERARMGFLVASGAIAWGFAVADASTELGAIMPPAGAVPTLVFLYLLSQSLLHRRVLDLYELTGRMTVLLGLSCMLAGLLFAFGYFTQGGIFWRSLFAAAVVLLVYDPVRERMQRWVSRLVFRERYDLEERAQHLRRRLNHVLELELLPELVLGELENSRRLTHAALYLVDRDMRSFRLTGSLGPAPPARIEFAAARPLLDRLRTDERIVLEQVEQERALLRGRNQSETTQELLQILEAIHGSVVCLIGSEKEVYGMLSVRDERLRDAFSPEDIEVLGQLASQIGGAVQNSRLHERMKERDRLAMMGEMAASLAHEVRNPLGAIKASAQYLREDPAYTDDNEFLDIIVEEADRLNRVLSSFLAYAHPAGGDALLTDVNAVVRRTVQVLGSEYGQVDWDGALRLEPALRPVVIDPEHLRQVLINLLQNALEAIQDRGTLRITTRERMLPAPEGGVRRYVEVEVSDTGPGIPEQVLATLFEPFVTTRTRGTGLGLAISQRLIRTAGGSIEVKSREAHGSAFTVRLPVAEPTPGSESESESMPAAEDDGSSDGGDTPSEMGSNR